MTVLWARHYYYFEFKNHAIQKLDYGLWWLKNKAEEGLEGEVRAGIQEISEGRREWLMAQMAVLLACMGDSR